MLRRILSIRAVRLLALGTALLSALVAAAVSGANRVHLGTDVLARSRGSS